MQELLPLDQSSRYPGHAAALAAKDAEDVLDGRYLEQLVEEARRIFPDCQVLWLYFRCKSGDKNKGWAPVKTCMLHAEWGSHLANCGIYDGGAHGLLVFVGLHLQGQLASAKAA